MTTWIVLAIAGFLCGLLLGALRGALALAVLIVITSVVVGLTQRDGFMLALVVLSFGAGFVLLFGGTALAIGAALRAVIVRLRRVG